MFLTHSLNYRRQRHLAAKHKNAKTKRLPYEIWKNKNAIRLRIFYHILYYLLRIEQKNFCPCEATKCGSLPWVTLVLYTYQFYLKCPNMPPDLELAI